MLVHFLFVLEKYYETNRYILSDGKTGAGVEVSLGKNPLPSESQRRGGIRLRDESLRGSFVWRGTEPVETTI